ncbi:esterase family protein [bacterium]|nr:MAG: esterase family protein [bacterium]
MTPTLALILAVQEPKAPGKFVDTARLLPYTKSADVGDYYVRPPYANAPELTPRTDVPKGRVVRFTMDSRESRFYPGIDKTKPGVIVPYTRRVTVYIPATPGPKPLPFSITQDSMGQGVMPTMLDNMIADKRLPAMAAIFMDSGGNDSYGSQRGLEYDTLNGHFAEFVEAEVLPRVEKECGIKLTKDPNGRMTMGGSSGGACAFTMAWYHPDLYHKVLSYSGTFVNQQWPPDPDTLRGAWEYHATLIPNAKRKPLRVWLHVSEHDLRYLDPEETWHNWPMSDDRMAKALKAKGYPYQFVYSYDSVHVDGRVVNQTLPQAMEWVWKGYRK